MSERISKTALKTMERKTRHDYVSKVYRAILKCIADCTDNSRVRVDMQFHNNNLNRYINLHRYGRNIKINIYKDGNIIVEKKALESETEQQTFDYESIKECTTEFLKELSTTIKKTIEEFWS